jgi:hypothetical protein
LKSFSVRLLKGTFDIITLSLIQLIADGGVIRHSVPLSISLQHRHLRKMGRTLADRST